LLKNVNFLTHILFSLQTFQIIEFRLIPVNPLGDCNTDGTVGGHYMDDWGAANEGSDTNEGVCFGRAKEIWEYCANRPDQKIKATFLNTGKSATYPDGGKKTLPFPGLYIGPNATAPPPPLTLSEIIFFPLPRYINSARTLFVSFLPLFALILLFLLQLLNCS
jgi:hypothetical protein